MLNKRVLIMEKSKKKKTRNAVLRDNKTMCRHDYKNAIQIGNVEGSMKEP